VKESIGTYVSACNAALGFPGKNNFSVSSIVIRRIKLAVDPLKPGGYCDYHRVSGKKFCFPPTQFIYVFCVDHRTKSDYFPIQH
jgi:hypothetical protein